MHSVEKLVALVEVGRAFLVIDPPVALGADSLLHMRGGRTVARWYLSHDPPGFQKKSPMQGLSMTGLGSASQPKRPTAANVVSEMRQRLHYDELDILDLPELSNSKTQERRHDQER
jgi:hypothetical protein